MDEKYYNLDAEKTPDHNRNQARSYNPIFLLDLLCIYYQSGT